MSTNGVEIGSELKECDMRCEGVDRISQLPDETIVHILSFLPVLKEVVATSILSSRWLSLWKYNPNLVFVYKCSDGPLNIPIVMPPIVGPLDWNIDRSLKTAEWVNSVLNSCKAPSLKQFTISFNLHPKTFYHVSKWLHFAFSKQVENLKLDLEVSCFCLGINILSGIQSSDYKFLKELTLENLEVTGEAIEFLLHNCSVLEQLIMNAILMSDLVIGGGTLKYLEINTPESCGRFIKVCAPNVTRLSCNYDLERLSLENVPNLVDASFDLLPHEGTMHHVANAAATLESLTITFDRPTAFPVPQMPKLKKVVLNYTIVNEEFLLPVTCLLQASPCLKEFKLEISDPQKYSDRDSSICTAILEVPKLGSFQHDHLKVFEFSGFCDKAADHVELVMYIANNCVALDEIIITPTASLARQFLMKFLLRAHQYLRRGIGIHYGSFSYKGDDAQEQEALDMKESTEQLLAGKLPDHIKLLVNSFVASMSSDGE